MSLTIKCRIKDKGEIVWPAIGEPELPGEPTDDLRRQARREWLREQIVRAAEDTRVALGSGEFARVHVSLTFKPDIMVDAA